MLRISISSSIKKYCCKSIQYALFVLLMLSGTIENATATDKQEYISFYLSADFIGTRAAGVSIEQGIRTALSEVNNQVAGIPVRVQILDHRGNTRRAKVHLNQYLNDSFALVLFGGLHSPPLLAARDYINQYEILVLSAWAAAAPITRYPSKKNWIFRLSIDDSKAGYVITKHAVNHGKSKRPALLLENTGWGKSNHKTMKKALQEQGVVLSDVRWFNWGLTETSARILIRNIRQNGADSIFLVANAPEGKVIAQAMYSLPIQERLPIYSHWGITGGDFSQVVNASMRKGLSIDFIQTSFSFMNPLNSLGQSVLKQAQSLFPESIHKPIDIKAPTGFIHAYDLTKIIITAIKQIAWKKDIKSDRRALRDALEQLGTPVEGLIKTYRQPFSTYESNNPDAHEALSIDDFTMARYGENNEIVLYPLTEP
ncbi:hypothetical protein CI610_00584 [invertebrate metagenome]|uniref:Leucine-binding protein domain-containing protein n=1 Tax=invertebrate metagenome TaxID=1711999 RepID=A0A2H9TB83_9ZZZZ